jgi:hypothetical protein
MPSRPTTALTYRALDHTRAAASHLPKPGSKPSRRLHDLSSPFTKTTFTVSLPTIARRMASSAARSEVVPHADLESFQAHLNKSTRILSLLGAGISASSGLPTFRGAGGLWRTHNAVQLATPEAFSRDPGLVWQFYSHRRHMALQAKPNPGHYALAELARKKDGFMTLSQNVDGKPSSFQQIPPLITDNIPKASPRAQITRQKN